jgi:hypothetical protein
MPEQQPGPIPEMPPPGRAKVAARPQPEQRPKKSFFLQRLRRQDIILLTGLLSLACLSVIVVGLLILRFQQSGVAAGNGLAGSPARPGPQATHTVSFTQVTGLSQYPAARARAQAWAADAQLVSANANWPTVLSDGQVGEPGLWGYHFYSPGKGRLFIVNVEADGRLFAVEHVAAITLPPPLLETGNWVVDSPAALATWLDYGGADLIRRNPGLEVLIQLRHLNNYPNPVWLVIGTDRRTQDIRTVMIDTTDGSVVRVDSSP